MRPAEWNHGFTDVDGQPDPTEWIRVLDTLRREPLYAAYKRRGTQKVGIPDQDLARRVLRFRTELALRNGTLAPELGRLFTDAGLTEVHVQEMPIVLRDPTALDNAMGLREWARFAHERRLIDAEDVEAWQRALDDAAANDAFLYSFSIFVTTGRRAA